VLFVEGGRASSPVGPALQSTDPAAGLTARSAVQSTSFDFEQPQASAVEG
jgi:hypothetical protein